MKKIKILIPIYNDWQSFYKLLSDIDKHLERSVHDISLIVVNDASSEKNLNKYLYYNGNEAVIDIINFKIFTSNKVEKKLINLLENYKDKVIPIIPITAKTLMNDFNIPEGKTLGNKFKSIEEIWVNNGFKISDKQVQKVIKG